MGNIAIAAPSRHLAAIVTNIMSLSWIKRWIYLHLLGKKNY